MAFITLPKTFWSKVNKDGPNGCWEWTGTIDHKGYGRIKSQGRQMFAHRISFSYANPDFDLSLFVLHHCDNPLCVNPGHLFAGTHLDNMRDMVSKGRKMQQQKTHCNYGHEFTPDNTYIKKGKWRVCAECERERKRSGGRYNEKKKAYYKQWAAENKERLAANARKWRAAKKLATKAA